MILEVPQVVRLPIFGGLLHQRQIRIAESAAWLIIWLRYLWWHSNWLWRCAWIQADFCGASSSTQCSLTLPSLAVGSFGRVMLAKNKKSGDYFVMKRLKKADIIKLRQVNHVISENTILADIDHPYLVSTRACPHLSIVASSLECIWPTLATGGTRRILSGLQVPVLFNAIHPRWRTVHLPENWRQTQGRACYVSLFLNTFSCLCGYVTSMPFMIRLILL